MSQTDQTQQVTEPSRKIVFHLRPWEVDLYLKLEGYLSKNSDMNLDFLYITHHFKAEHLLRMKGRNCLNVNRELEKIPIPDDWRECLQEIEDRYLGQVRNFYQYLAAERYLKEEPREYQTQQLYRTVTFFDSYFKKHKPFFMLSNGPDHMAFWLAMDLLRCHGGHPCGLVPTAWPKNHVILYRQVGHSYLAKDIYTDILERGLTQSEKQEARNRQDALRRGRSVPDFIQKDKQESARRRSIGQRIRSRLNSIYWQIMERRLGGWHIRPIPIPGRIWLRKKWIELRAKIADRYMVDKWDESVPFVYFPLHVEPEATTLVHANFYDNQLEVIRMLSKALPISWQLVVKEHPNMVGRRSWQFIRQVKKLPNVVFIRSDKPSWQLIQKAHLTVVLTSNAGLEACVLGRPVLAFGNPAWDYAPTFRKVGDITALNESLLEAAEAGLPPEDDRVQAFILSWVQANPKGIYAYFPWLPPVDRPDNVRQIGQALVNLLHGLDENAPGKTPGQREVITSENAV